jgi:hypothetical protein
MESGAKGGKKHQISRFDPTLSAGLPEGEGNRSGTGVAVILDIDEQLLIFNVQRLLKGADDPEVGLVGYDEREIRNLDTSVGENRAR